MSFKAFFLQWWWIGPDIKFVTFRFLEFGHCVFRCQEGYYEFVSIDDDIVIRECRPCHRNCATCDGGSQENCTTCKQGLVLSTGGRCTSHCASL